MLFKKPPLAAEKGPNGYIDRTQGGVMRNLLALSWPMVITESIYLVTVVEMVWLGRLGAAPVAGAGIAFVIVSLVITAEVGLTTAARALIARAVGSGDVAAANHIARQALLMAVVYGALMTVMGVFLSRPVLSLFRVEPDVLSQGVTYLRFFSLGWVPVCFWLMGYSIIQASGDSVNPMKVEIVMRGFLLALTPFLVLGWGFFPQLGIMGAGLSNAVAEAVGMSLGMWLLMSGHTRLRLTVRDFRMDFNVMLRILKLGWPASVMTMQNSLGGTVIMVLMAPFGTVAVAAHSLINRISMLLFMPTYGLSLGAGVLVGLNLGAGQSSRAERTGWLASTLTGGFSVAGALAALLWAESVVGLFTTDPALIETASVFLRISAVAFVATGLGNPLLQGISGAGETVMPMVVVLVTIWAVQMPLAFLLPGVGGLDVLGVRWAIVAAAAAGATAYVAYFRSGRWKQKKI